MAHGAPHPRSIYHGHQGSTIACSHGCARGDGCALTSVPAPSSPPHLRRRIGFAPSSRASTEMLLRMLLLGHFPRHGAGASARPARRSSPSAVQMHQRLCLLLVRFPCPRLWVTFAAIFLCSFGGGG